MTRNEALEFLEIKEPNPTPDIINKQFRLLARKYHPDVGGNSESFRMLSDAKEILEKKSEPQKLEPLIIQFEISIDDYVEQKEVTIVFNTLKQCKNCQATGFNLASNSYTCISCNGSGRHQTLIINGMQIEQRCNACKGSGKCFSEKCLFCSGKSIHQETKKWCMKLTPGCLLISPILQRMGNEDILGNISDVIVNFVVVQSENAKLDNNGNLHMIYKVNCLEYLLEKEVDVVILNNKYKVKINKDLNHYHIINHAGIEITPGSKTNCYLKIIPDFNILLNESQKNKIEEVIKNE